MAHSTYQSDCLSCCYLCITKCCTQNSLVGICTLWKLYLIKSIWPYFINRPMIQTLGVKSCCLRGAQKPPSWFLLCCHPIKKDFLICHLEQNSSNSIFLTLLSLLLSIHPHDSLLFSMILFMITSCQLPDCFTSWLMTVFL